ncbi:MULTISPECIES: hypothetical protein [Brevundimonas]|uniref:hypothetical protein n=1 Tax=Brevundimonas TaxID=41275 RepID=UPI000F04383E|nr:hypothetical protein [Brevundimonas lutea]
MNRLIAIIAALVAGLALLSVASASAAQAPTVSRSPATSPQLGRVIAGATTTTFSISTAGAVTRTSGDAIRLTNTSVTAPTVTISCGLLNLNSVCALRNIRVTVTATGATGETRIVRLRAGTLTGSTYRAGGVREGTTLTFDINPIGILGSASFPLGMDVQVDAGAQPGADSFTYTVTAQFL